MPINLSQKLRNKPKDSEVAAGVREYNERYRTGKRGEWEEKKRASREFAILYYDLVTDFFEYGWGRSFHFAPRKPGESFKASLARHERRIADTLDLKPGMVAADLGCGVGGPLMEIARYSGANIVGVNANEYQLKRARKLTKEADLTHLADFLHCDFLNVDAPDESFDAVYAIEATCHAPDKVSVYGEAFRLLKPGACFANYEWCMTDRFDPDNLLHQRIKADIELGVGVVQIDGRQTVDDAFEAVGFEVLEIRDLAIQDGPSIPWHQPLVGSGLSFASFRSSRIGRWITQNILKILETLRIAPKGSVHVSEMLNLGADALVEAGRLGIFTPMYFIHARKPAS